LNYIIERKIAKKLIAYNVKNLNKGKIYGSEEMLERYDNFYEHKNGNI
jgi:hypothetical protein